MTDTDRDSTRLRENAPEKPVQRDMGWKATSTPLGGVEAPHGQISPSRSIVDDVVAVAAATRHAVGGHATNIVGGTITLSTDDPRRIAELLSRQRGHLATIALLETQLAEERAKVAALSQPRVFTLSGVVDGDLAERYQNLREAHDAVLASLDAANARISTLAVEREEAVRFGAEQEMKAAGLWDRIEQLEADLAAATARADEMGDLTDAAQNHAAEAIQIAQDRTAERDALTKVTWRKDSEIADLKAERDAAAENARRERDQHAATVASLDWVQQAFEEGDLPPSYWGIARGEALRRWLGDLVREVERLKRSHDRRGTYTNDDLVRLSKEVRQSILILGDPMDDGERGAQKRRAIAEVILRAHGLRSITEQRPVVRVVTSPRFYGFDEQRAAADALDKHTHDLGFHMREMHRLELVETVAEALGMRRARS